MTGHQLELNHFESQKHSLCIEFEKSWSRCRSLTGRLDQYFVFGRLDDCSSLKECCASVCDNNSRLRKPVCEWGQIENRCFEWWANYENVVGSNVESEGGRVWASRAGGFDWNHELPPDLKRRTREAFKNVPAP